MGRLLIWERAAVGLRLDTSIVHGRWDPDGQWTTAAPGTRDLEIRTSAWGMIRATRRAAIYLDVPWARIVRSTPDLDERGGGVGDIVAGWRQQIVEIGEYRRIPGVAFTLSALAPSGRATDESHTTLGSDVTSRGAWRTQASVEVEWSVMPWFVQVGAGAGYHFARYRGDIDARLRFGPVATASVATGVEVARDLVGSLTASITREGAIHTDGEPVDNSGQTDVRIGTSWSYRLAPHWTAQLGASTGVFADGFGDNRLGDIMVNGGLRFGIF